MARVSNILSDPTFLEAISEIKALGLQVSDFPTPGATAYGIVGGRSNSRWWLVPLTNRHVATSGMALFQPILLSAKVIKRVALIITGLGLSSLWAKKKIYISGTSAISEKFGESDLHFAYFTGTNSPHRKVAVQVMDRLGRIKGFAKVTKRAKVKPLLGYEARTLDYLNTLNFQTAQIPRVLFNGQHGNLSLLITDTLKTPCSKTRLTLEEAHLAFLSELAKSTVSSSQQSKTRLSDELQTRYAVLADRPPPQWQHRIEHGISYLSQHQNDLPLPSLSHGDFTPWNTFFVDGQLYVFDWEYADHIYPSGYDLIHFMLAMPDTYRLSAASKIELIVKKLHGTHCANSPQVAKAIFMAYLCGHTLHFIGRETVSGGLVNLWDGADKIAALFDELIDQGSVTQH